MAKQLFSALIFSFFTALLAPGVNAQPRELPDFADLVEKQGAAVVNVSTQARARAMRGNPFDGLSEDDPFYEFFRRFMPPEPQRRPGPRGGLPRGDAPLRPYGQGSGFIISSDGYVLTNAHVVDKADEVTITLNDKREFKAKVVGSDSRSDVAVLKVDTSGLPKVNIGDSNKLRVGEWVVAIGSPFGFRNTVTAGIVSYKGRDELGQGGVPFIQTDVAVNPGNSGGPLFNTRGEVVGINSQIFSGTGGYQGISFAIPIDEAMRISDQLIKTGRVSRGRLGILISNVTKDAAEAMGLSKAQGAVVQSVEKDTPAEKAGIKEGDIILKVDGKAVEGSAEVTRLIGATKPGSKVNLSIWRNGAARDITATIGETKDESTVKTAANEKEVKPGRLGIGATDLTAEQKKELKVEHGVYVSSVRGGADMILNPGDVILRVNNTDITSAKQFNELAAKLDLKKTIALLVKNEQGTRFVTFRSDGD